MENQEKKSTYLETWVKQIGKKAVSERISGYISDICKAAPSSKDTDEVIQFLLYLRGDILKSNSAE